MSPRTQADELRVHAGRVSLESGDEDATKSKEHLEGVDPFLGPVLDPFVAVRRPS